MFDTKVTVVGTALNTPEHKIIKNDAYVAHFRVAARSRRFDKEAQQWVDGANFRVRVSAWRRLGEFVRSSIVAGDPVIVYGRIVTREWKTEQGEARLSYELEAEAVGHDLARGSSQFTRWRPEPYALVVEDPDADEAGAAELAETVAEPGGEYEELSPIALGLGSGAFGSADAEGDRDAMAILQEAGFDPVGEPNGGEGDDTDGEGGGSGGQRRRRGRAPVPA